MITIRGPNGVTDLRPDYVEAVTAAGLLRTLDGRSYVAGEFEDPVSGERQCLVEYYDPRLTTTTTDVKGFARALVAAFPSVDSLMLRAPAGDELPKPWERRLTYVRYAGEPAVRPDGVVEAAPEHAAVTTQWLRQALVNGYASQGRTPAAEAVASTISQVMTAPDRATYIAVSGGVPVGHVTMLSDRSDEVTGEPIVELYDILVETTGDRGGVTSRLIAAAIAYAAGVGRPLIGNVVHRPGSDAGEHGMRVLHGLMSRGWEPDHVFWSARARDVEP